VSDRGTDGVTCVVDDPVAVITLDRPERLNALTPSMLRAFREAIDAAAADPAVVGIVVTGAGRGFCSGLDASVLEETTAAAETARSSMDTGARRGDLPGLFSYLLRVPKPVVAAVNGVAAGGGLVLAALCDVRFAGPDASFTTIFLQRGLVAEHGTSWVLPRLLGPGRALDLLWTSRRIDAQEAERCGLVEHVTEGDVVAAACDYVRTLATVASPSAIAATKRMVYEHLGLGFPEALRDADETAWAAVASADAAEGARALLERRAPQFGRLAT
jgi:enoyl-CoA hydratase/carnithine racemase